MMTIKEYKDRVINLFKNNKATQQDWELLGNIFLRSSENGEEGSEEFDQRILTKKEFQRMYHVDENGELKQFKDWVSPE